MVEGKNETSVCAWKIDELEDRFCDADRRLVCEAGTARILSDASTKSARTGGHAVAVAWKFDARCTEWPRRSMRAACCSTPSPDGWLMPRSRFRDAGDDDLLLPYDSLPTIGGPSVIVDS